MRNHYHLPPYFPTDFQRQSWLIECGNGTQIEVALDRRGDYRAGQKPRRFAKSNLN